MKKILGLDLGVGSVGWALILTDDSYEPLSILGMGSRIVPLGKTEGDSFSKGKSESVCAERTTARTARKTLDRYQMRRHQLTVRLGELGMTDPADKMLTLSPMEIWQLRADAATEGRRLTLPQIGRVLLHLNQKRGYRHSKSDASDAQQTAYVAAVNERFKRIRALGMSVGQYFAKGLKESEQTTPDGKKVYTYRIKEQVLPRQAYEEEFDRIMDAQSVYYPEVLTPEVQAELKNIIFYQRPLKSCKHLVSHCEFTRHLFRDCHSDGKMAEGGPKVAPVSSPLAQMCRLYEAINNISLVNPFNKKRDSASAGLFDSCFGVKSKDARLMQYEYVFTDDERSRIFDYLNNNEKLTGTQLLKILGLKKADGFKFDQLIGKGIKGNMTLLALRNALEGVENADELLRFDITIKDLVKDGKPVIDEETGEVVKTVDEDYIHQPLYQLWHLVYSISDREELAKAIERKYGEKYPGICAPEVVDRLFAIDFVKEGYANKSAKFMRMLLPALMKGYKYSEAASIVQVNHSGSLTKDENLARELKPRLSNLEKGALRQPTVEKILNQMINVVNAIIDKFGPVDEIRVELARSLKQSKDERVAATEAISKNEKENEKIAGILREHGLNPTRRNIQKYKLFTETGGCCIYCGSTVSLTEFIGGHGVEVEHIIPRSRFFDDSLSNKACACRSCNSLKNNRTAYDFMESQGEEKFNRYLERVETLTADKKISRTKHNRLLTAGKDIPSDFLNRDLRETQYISRKAREILKEICHDVHATSGSVTDFFRHAWGYDNILHTLNFSRYQQAGLVEEVEYSTGGQVHRELRIKDWSKRLDHRHHSVDALVAALTRQGYVQRLNNLNRDRDAMFSEITAQSPEVKENFRLLTEWAATRPHFPVKEVEDAVDRVAVSFKAGKKVTTPGKRKAMRGGKRVVVQEGLSVPRGALHKETVYGIIKVVDPAKPLKFAIQNLHLVVDAEIRTQLKKILEANHGDISKSLAYLKKNPIIKNREKVEAVDCFREEVVVRYPVESLEYKHLESVVDPAVREAIRDRFDEPEIGRNTKKFQKSLAERPILTDENMGIPVKRVRCFTGNQLSKMLPVRKDGKGNVIGYAQSGNNHHVAFYKDEDGKVQTLVTTFWDTVKRHALGIPLIVTDPTSAWERVNNSTDNEETAGVALGLPSPHWTFLESMRMNEMFILGLSDEEIEDAKACGNMALLASHLYRVQKLSIGDYNFRLHASTNVDRNKAEKELEKWKLIASYKAFVAENPKKVRVSMLGEIVFD